MRPTSFDLNNLSSSPNARRVTCGKEDGSRPKGRIDVEMAEQFLSDHDGQLHRQGRAPMSARSAAMWTK